MNRRLLSVFAFALLVSAAASAGLYRLISTKMTASAKTPGVKVMVSARQMDPGNMIKDADVREADWSGVIPKGAILNKQDIVGRGVISTVFEGEPIVETRLAAK